MKKVFKKGYSGNESLDLSWDHVEVFQMTPFYTASDFVSFILKESTPQFSAFMQTSLN